MLYKLFLLYYLYKSDTSFFLLTFYFMFLKTYKVPSSQCPFFYAILGRLCFIVITKERFDLSNEFIEADVTYIIKELQSFSVHQRRNCRNHCSNYCIAAVNRTGTCIRRRTGGWYLHCDCCRASAIKHIVVKDFTTCLVLRMRSVPALDSTAMNALVDLVEVCESKGITVVFSHVNEQPMKVMEKAGFTELIGKENFQPNISAALKRAEEVIAE